MQRLFNLIGGADGTSFATIQEMANKTTSASDIREKGYEKRRGQDVEVTLAGLEWEVVYLSTDTDGNAILTLWLDNNQQPGWTGKSQTEGAFYGFYDGGLYSDWSADWYTSSTSEGTADFYPANMYGTSYIRAVTLNNGGQYATSNTALTTAYQNSSSVFAPFTMSSSGLYNYIVTPAKVSWQEKQSATATGGASSSYDYPNDEWNPSTERGKYYSDAYNYVEHNGYNTWKDDKIWLPSMAETGYNDSHLGLWGVSIDQRKNFDGSTTSISGQKVGSSNTKNVSSLYTYSWLRSGPSYAYNAYYLYPSGSDYDSTPVLSSSAVRPALHLNLTSIAENIWGWLLHTSGKDFANSGHQGTEGDPYEISSAEDLAQLAKDVDDRNTYQGKFFRQTADINLGGHRWTPSNGFSGSFDGEGFKIVGLNIPEDGSGRFYVGLFGEVRGTAENYITLKNINVYGSITARCQYAGGIAGHIDGGGIMTASALGITIDNCKSAVNIVSDLDAAGGIVGCWDMSSETVNVIKNCRNSGNITASNDSHVSIGGIVGGAIWASEYDIADCFNSGMLCSNSTGSAVGGIVGSTVSVTITRCQNIGTVSGIAEVGSICGSTNTIKIENCFGSGQIVVPSAGISLGLIGQVTDSSKFGFLAPQIDIIGSCFVGTSNVDLSFGDYSFITITSSYMLCNDKKVCSQADSSEDYWSKYWALVPNLNDGLPVQKELFSIASAATTKESELKQFFSSWS